MTEVLYLSTLFFFSLLTGGLVWLCDSLGDSLGDHLNNPLRDQRGGQAQ